MDTVTIQLLSREPHLSQILTGFTMLSKGKNRILAINVEDLSADSQEPFRGSLLRVRYWDKVISAI